jgi:hypothetical protein
MVSEIFGSGDASIADVLDVLDATGNLTYASYVSDRVIAQLVFHKGCEGHQP